MEQVEDNLGAAGWALDNDQIARLEAVGDCPLPYPYETHARLARS